MSHYEIDYKGMDANKKRTKALTDVKQFLGRAMYNKIMTVAMECHCYRQFSFYAGFVGVQGYPVVAMWDQTQENHKDMMS